MAPLPALSHAIETQFSGLGSGSLLELESSFSSGEPVSNAEVRLLSHDGERTIPLGSTDADGRFSTTLPELDSNNWDLVIDGGIGHRDYLGLDEDMEISAGNRRSLMVAMASLLSATLAVTGSISYGQRQRRP